MPTPNPAPNSPQDSEKSDEKAALTPKTEVKPKSKELQDAPVAAVESDVAQQTGDIIEEDDDLLIEEDNDFFWVIQRAVWGIIKTLVVVGGIGFFVWVIWFGDSPTPAIPTPTETTSETEPVAEAPTPWFWESWFSKAPSSAVEEPPASEPVPATKPPQNSTPPQKRPASSLPLAPPPQELSLVKSSVAWLHNAGSFLSLPSARLIPSNVPTLRAQRVEAILSDIRGLLRQSETLQQQLFEEFNRLTELSRESSSDSVTNGEAFFNALHAFQGFEAETFLDQKVKAEQNVVKYSALASGRNIILQNIQHYDSRLRRLYQDLVANKEAVIQNIQVVDFPDSSLEIILSPLEWQAIGPGRR